MKGKILQFLFKFFNVVQFLFVYAYGSTGHCQGVEVGGKFMGVLFLHCVDPRDQTLAVRMGSTSLSHGTISLVFASSSDNLSKGSYWVSLQLP